MSLIAFILVLSFLVIIHEAGHFLTAKKFGIKVHEFGLGYPPKALRLFIWRGTEFTLNWIPFGGFVRMEGEDRGSESGEVAANEVFNSKPVWQRLIVILAGAFINFVFGVLIFSALFSFMGIPERVPLEQGVSITAISPDSPAAEAELFPGDIIIAVSYLGEMTEIATLDTFVATLADKGGSEVTLSLQREEEILEKSVYVRSSEEIPQGDGAMGIGIDDHTLEFVKYPIWQMPFRGALEGINVSLNFGLMILVALGDMISGAFAGQVPSDVAGPVGIAYTAQKENLLAQGVEALLNFTAILSINLAIVNVLPIPALDGGRAFFLILEKALGNRFKPEYEQYANGAGMLFLLSLIILISVRDVGVIFSDFGWTFSRLINLISG